MTGEDAHPPPVAGRSGAAHHRFGAAAVSLSLITAALWGGTAVGSAFALDALPPIAVGGIRFALAALFMIGWCRWERSPLLLKPQQWSPSVISGVLLFFQIATFNWGQARTTSSHTSLFINTYIFWVAAYEHFITRQFRMNWRQLAGLMIAAGGVLLLVASTAAPAKRTSGMDEPTLLGDAIMLLSGFILGVKVIQTKHAVRTVPPGTLTLWHDLIGVALFALYSAVFETIDPSRITPATVWSLLFVGLAVSGFCFAGQAWLLQRHSASLVSVFSFATPVFGVALAVLLRGDALSPWLLFAGACVAIGIVLVTVRSPAGRA
ncbi:MAG: DMT family transporter [Planctomycetaceae bacterium]|nr:DMT family transporter [Planctomycetaceae bacterium]